MKQSIVTSLQQLRAHWRKNNFRLTDEEQVRYDALLATRRQQVWEWEGNEVQQTP